MGRDALVTDKLASLGGPTGEGTLMTFAPEPRKPPEPRGDEVQGRQVRP